MSNARYYIYRNLTKNCFSVKYKGKVIAYCDSFVAENAHTKVNQATRAKVLHQKKKYVHAYVVCDKVSLDQTFKTSNLSELKYNPHKQNTFTLSGVPCDNVTFSYIVGDAGKVYASQIKEIKK